MLSEVGPHVSASLRVQLEHRLGLAPDLGASHLDVERVVGIAVVAAAHSGGYAATGHLLGRWPRDRRTLLVGLVEVVRYRLPATRPYQDRRTAGPGRRGTALARQILSAVDEMTPPQRVAAGGIGQALAESDHFPPLETQVIGELWLRDLELTAWHVLHADCRADDPTGRSAFLEVWTSI